MYLCQICDAQLCFSTQNIHSQNTTTLREASTENAWKTPINIGTKVKNRN